MNREIYQNVLRGLQDSPQFGGCDRSPMTSLTNTLYEASLANTPCKRLSLSSTLTNTPQSPNCSSFSSNGSQSLENSSISSEEKLSLLSPTSILSSPRNKENLPTPYYSPSHDLICRQQTSPLRKVQNPATRNLNFSPLKKPISPSRREHLSPIKKPTPPDDCDSNSRDSGYCESGQKRDGFNVPRACAPSRKLNLDMSPKYSPFKSPCEGRKGRSFASLKKKSCDEDEFLMEFICGEEGVKEDSTSSAFSSLLSAPIQSCQASSSVLSSNGPRLPIRRCLSMVDTSTPVSSRVKSLEKNMDILKEASSPCFLISSFKRPQSPSASPDAKRRKEESGGNPLAVTKSSNHGATVKPQGSPKVSLSQRQLSDPEPTSKDLCRPKIQRCHSESHVSIMKALNNASNNNGNLTGDFTQPLSLPVISGGKHPDLKSIDIHTMSALMQGAFQDKVTSFKILDCRYPYEYKGGHITTAVNWHHPKIVEEYLNSLDKPPKLTGLEAPRHILIFHCEFSAERGPRTQRMLRELDRTMNKEHYPALHFPELYLLEGGYKAFYEIYPEHCSPVDYVKMLDENHSEDFKFFRSKSKSWAAENRQSRCPVPRTGPKRLGL